MRKSIVFAILFIVLYGMRPSHAGTYISTIGFSAECPKTGTESVIGPACSTWCKSTYGQTYNGSSVIAVTCKSLGITDSKYEYCCTSNATLNIVEQCRCDDPNQITVAGTGGKSYKMTLNSDGSYTYTCQNLYCFCDTKYYGNRQLMTASRAGACTECPCMDDTYSVSGGQLLCSWTANNYLGFTDNANAPSYKITDCKAGPVSSGVPQTYRTYEGPEGTFILNGPCKYEE